ncbi:MAG: hypothetical protein KBF73_07070, partial [Flavobacteriales bacterium]|nr:hypothetical protein [Flavobacteriales bacterium]
SLQNDASVAVSLSSTTTNIHVPSEARPIGTYQAIAYPFGSACMVLKCSKAGAHMCFTGSTST